MPNYVKEKIKPNGNKMIRNFADNIAGAFSVYKVKSNIDKALIHSKFKD